MAGGSKALTTSREHTGDRATDAIQRARDEIARWINLCPFVRGRLISVALTAGTGKTVAHGLGTPAAFFIARQNYDGTGNVTAIVESSTSFQAGLDPNHQMNIVASVSCIVDLWFYPRASEAVPR